MKALIATAILALAGNAANADHLSRFDSQEFYTGQADSRLVTLGLGMDSELYLEGNFPVIFDTAKPGTQNVLVCQATSQQSLYTEGHWPI
jgi:hypothetical protein